jgi:hypothetical protein
LVKLVFHRIYDPPISGTLVGMLLPGSGMINPRLGTLLPDLGTAIPKLGSSAGGEMIVKLEGVDVDTELA